MRTILVSIVLVVATGQPFAPFSTNSVSAGPANTSISWLAAGDSYSSGEGLPHSIDTCAQANPGSGSTTWAQEAYQDVQATEPSPQPPDLVACTGAKSNQFINQPDRYGHPEWSPTMGRFDLVTFTFGGDDIGFTQILLQCLGLTLDESVFDEEEGFKPPQLLPTDPGHLCPKDSILRARVATLGGPASADGSYRSFLTQVADEVVQHGGNVVVLGYPEFVELPQFWPSWARALRACWGIGRSDAYELRGLAGDLNATIGGAVADMNQSAPNGVHFRFIDVNTGSHGIASSDQDLFEPSTGPRHNLCAAQEWLNGFTGIDYFSGSFHPNQQGLDHEGALLAQVLPQLDWTGLAADSIACSGSSPNPGVSASTTVSLGDFRLDVTTTNSTYGPPTRGTLTASWQEGGAVVATTSSNGLGGYDLFTYAIQAPGSSGFACIGSFGGPTPVGMIDLDSGGAHCCTTIRAFVPGQGGRDFVTTNWQLGNGGAQFKYVDGALVLSGWDQRFSYQWASYAASGTPILLQTVNEGNLFDVTNRYPDVIRTDAARQWNYAHASDDAGQQDGAYAAWMEDQCRLGKTSAGWETLQGLAVQGVLDEPQVVTGYQFLTQLQHILRQTGLCGSFAR